jgi:hypothetical protein
MREDMAKIIVERPRIGWGKQRNRSAIRRMRHAAKLDPENAPAVRGMRRLPKQTGSEKYLNENLAPLRRFLEGAVGRPWNAVYSEICQNIRPSSAVQLHILQHVAEFVETTPETGRWFRPMFRVDPKDGILKRIPERPRTARISAAAPKSCERFRAADEPTLQYWKVGNDWYRIECRTRYANEIHLQVWNVRVPGWFRDLVNSTALTFGPIPTAERSSPVSEAALLVDALGPGLFPMKAVPIDAAEANRQFHRWAKRGVEFIPHDPQRRGRGRRA